MSKNRKKTWLILGIILFVVYIFAAARPVPVETILSARWLSSLESDHPVFLDGEETQNTRNDGAEGKKLIPFKLGGRFGYLKWDGRFVLNLPGKNNISLSPDRWAEYGAGQQPANGQSVDLKSIEVKNPAGEVLLNIENARGYPFFLDGRIFLVGGERNTLSALDDNGQTLWKYDFAAPITCLDAAGGYVLTGSLDGIVEMLNSEGKRVYFFEPGGSRLSLIAGCALSSDAGMMALVSGADDQRFLLLERYGDVDYRVIYHRFVEDGFRRPVYVSFINRDSRVVYEREGGIGVYDIGMRNNVMIPVDGEITSIDGGGKLLFAVSSLADNRKQFVAAKISGSMVMKAPFKSEDAFLSRDGDRVYVGGGSVLAAFDIESR